MKFSIITVCYNSSATIRNAIESVLTQTYRDIEYIIVDGASTDGTLDIIKEYEPSFNGRMHWISERDRGLYDAMNKGFAMATGDVIGLINSDDLFCDIDAIEMVVKKFKEDSSLDCVYADLYYVAKDNIYKIVRKWKSGEKRSFSKGWHPAHPTFYVKKAVYDRCGLFDLDFKLAADFELMLRLIEKERISIAYLPVPIVRMRLGGATSKNLTNIKRGNIECIRAFKKNGIAVSAFYPIYRLFPKLKQFLQ